MPSRNEIESDVDLRNSFPERVILMGPDTPETIAKNEEAARSLRVQLGLGASRDSGPGDLTPPRKRIKKQGT